MGSCAAPSAKGDDKFITTDYLQQCPKQLLPKTTVKREHLRYRKAALYLTLGMFSRREILRNKVYGIFSSPFSIAENQPAIQIKFISAEQRIRFAD
ncbi:hypothetical protein [Citrobacter sp. CFNIH10]|uniref:hypothetical protein n=1 Tax=Citrobacter sp. CFNIH10 TaxID=1920110 RepID=UPI000CEB982A|nr:hypothetical protein [Citrobacter sp. CFNIH10]AUZ65566.1 hypothetical protein C2U53_17960 [Citrobacter sp. CFNIH10]